MIRYPTVARVGGASNVVMATVVGVIGGGCLEECDTMG